MQAPRPRATYRYWVCDLRTGNKLAELPLKPSGVLPERISDVSSVAFTCNQSELAPGADFNSLAVPGRTVVALEREYDGDNVSDILWAGPLVHLDAGDGPDATLSCATIAAYLGRRYVGTHVYNAGPGETDEQIIADLLADAAPEGIGIQLDLDCPTPRAVRYLEKQRRTVLSCLRDLADLDGGPEWTITAAWVDAARLAVRFTFVARTRLGHAGTPNVVLDFPGAVKTYRSPVDFTEGHGANAVTGVTSAGAASAPARDNAAILGGYPRWEAIAQKDGVTTLAGITGLARSGLAKQSRGQETLSLAVNLTDGPQLLRDLNLGDDVEFRVYGPDRPGAASPSYRHPAGHTETIRVIGYELDPASDTLTPILWSPYEET